jgi:very-short-patch-repair endonuclease
MLFISSPAFAGDRGRIEIAGGMRHRERQSLALAKDLRQRMTNAEVILWSRLRRGEIYGWRFRRQHPIGPYVADFACVPARLVVEVDGDRHSSTNGLLHDRRRDAYLQSRGWRVFRVTNQDIYKNLDNVLEAIVRQVELRLPPPPPRPTAGPPP